MVLRFVLVSLVAGLGCDLPRTADLSRWIDSSRTWLSAQVEIARVVGDDFIEVVDEETTAETPSLAVIAESEAPHSEQNLPESARRSADSLIIEVVDVDAEPALLQTVASVEQPVAEPEPVREEIALQADEDLDAAFETVVRDMAASFATESEETFALEPQRIAQENTERVVETEKENAEEHEPSRTDRLGVAVRLTGQALYAWVGVLQEKTPLVTSR